MCIIFQGYGYVAFPQIHRWLRLVFRFWQSGQKGRLWKHLQIFSLAHHSRTEGKSIGIVVNLIFFPLCLHFPCRRDSNTLRLYWPLQTMMIGSCLPILWSLLQNFNINLAITFLKRILCWFVWRARLDTGLENLWAKWLRNSRICLPFWPRLWITTTKVCPLLTDFEQNKTFSLLRINFVFFLINVFMLALIWFILENFANLRHWNQLIAAIL